METSFSQNVARERVVASLARITVAAALMIGTACSDSTGPGIRLKIEPAAPTIALQQTPQGLALNTSVTLTNNTDQPESWFSCGVALEKAGMPALPPGKAGWDMVWARICYLLENNPSALATNSSPGNLPDFVATLNPGQSVNISVSAMVGLNPYPNFKGESGQYRFFIPKFTTYLGHYYPVLHENSVSTPFTLLPAS